MFLGHAVFEEPESPGTHGSDRLIDIRRQRSDRPLILTSSTSSGQRPVSCGLHHLPPFVRERPYETSDMDAHYSRLPCCRM